MPAMDRIQELIRTSIDGVECASSDLSPSAKRQLQRALALLWAAFDEVDMLAEEERSEAGGPRRAGPPTLAAAVRQLDADLM
jgi:hypothetical protein